MPTKGSLIFNQIYPYFWRTVYGRLKSARAQIVKTFFLEIVFFQSDTRFLLEIKVKRTLFLVKIGDQVCTIQI